MSRSKHRWPEGNVEPDLQHWESLGGTYLPAPPVHDTQHPDFFYEDDHYYNPNDQGYVEPEHAEQNPVSRLADRADEFVIDLMGKWTLPVVRIGLAVIFFWFGVLKFFDGMSPAQGLVEDTVLELGNLLGFKSMPARQILFLLATWEVVIGVGLLINRYRRIFLFMLFLQLPGTILPVFLLPSVVWHAFPYGLTLEGQYIVKNLVLVGAALALGSQIRYDEQQARQTDIDWASDEEAFDELPLENQSNEYQHDDYWVGKMPHISLEEPAIHDRYLPHHTQVLDEPQPDSGQYFDVQPAHDYSYPGEVYDQPQQDNWIPAPPVQLPNIDSEPVWGDQQPGLTQEQDSFGSFWMTDSDQLQ